LLAKSECSEWLDGWGDEPIINSALKKLFLKNKQQAGAVRNFERSADASCQVLRQFSTTFACNAIL
jgi:hypothetical protein